MGIKPSTFGIRVTVSTFPIASYIDSRIMDIESPQPL